MTKRISACFEIAAHDKRPVLGVFATAGDPSEAEADRILDRLVENGADFIELGMPFSDPMADGPAIQAASLRALAAGMTLPKTLSMAARFRARHPDTPLILMGYYNPIYSYGTERFIADAVGGGVDGLIVVDLPPEEDAELCDPSRAAGLAFIRLVTPTTLGKRLVTVTEKAGGFVYYVAIAGITGTKSADVASIEAAVSRIKGVTALPVVTGFGIRTPEQAREAGSKGDGVVIGSAIVSLIADADIAERSQDGVIADKIGNFCATLSKAVRESY